MRTDNSIKNIVYSLGGQSISLFIKLISRFIFVKILTTEYLGLNGLFSNILSLLSLVELGIGPAMTYSMYKPLAFNENEKVKALMKLYKKIYTIIGILVLIIGISITPFLSSFINEMPEIPNINIIYILFVVNTGISYFYTYKRALLEADQKMYISTIYRQIFNFVLNVIQIIVIILTKNYILYLIVQVSITLIENIVVSAKTDKLYPYIKEKNVEKIDKETKDSILRNVSAMVFHKMAAVVVTGTDNLIISKYIGLVEVGLYSNYILVVGTLRNILNQIFTSITASVGNLVATESNDKTYDVFNKILFLNFWIYSFASVCLITLFNNFITLWLGDEYVFQIAIVIIIVINFYLYGMRRTVLMFRDALGLYWQDRYKTIFEAIINLVVSIILVKKMGIVGVLIGTFVSTVTTCLWVEPYILFKYGIKKNVLEYFKKFIKYTVLTILVASITYFLCNVLITTSGIISFIYKLIICLIIPNGIYILIFSKSEELKYFIKLLGSIKEQILKKENRI